MRNLISACTDRAFSKGLSPMAHMAPWAVSSENDNMPLRTLTCMLGSPSNKITLRKEQLIQWHAGEPFMAKGAFLEIRSLSDA